MVMWIAKLRIKHDCIFGNRCEKYNISTSIISFNPYQRNNNIFIEHFGTLHGSSKNINKYLNDLKKDKRVAYFEREKNTFFVLEKRKRKETPGSFYQQELIYVKPVIVDTRGVETWEFAAVKKSSLMKFINSYKESKILSITKTKIKDIYFPRLSPDLTQHQREALDLAIKEGYYEFPKKINLEKLAQISKLSFSAFREHLKRAEKKIIGELSK